tara:strand:- start:1147 stop:1311 length:165 start_codon:yes stop_codon:yes gene_type:complete
MAKITYKDAKTGKKLAKKAAEHMIKKYTKPTVVKEGKIYSLKYPTAKNKYEQGK